MSLPSTQTIAPALAGLFDEPGDDWSEQLRLVRNLLADHAPEARANVDRFMEDIEGLSPDALRELHTRTFDLAPICVPYLTVHLFGEESFKRAGLMSGLTEAYRAAAFESNGELPDHLALVLRFAPCMDPEEWNDLVQFVLKPALKSMAAPLTNAENPYRHLLTALHDLLAPDFTPEKFDA
jgi:nitrate reductase delta subunit